MLRYTLAIFLVVNFTNNVLAQSNSNSEKNIQHVVTNFFDALSELDAEKAKTFCTSEVAILESGKVWNFDSLALQINTRKVKSYDFKRINKLNFLKTNISGNTAWLYYMNEAMITFDGKMTHVKWIESAVLVKEKKGSWKISLLHSTEVERTP